MERKIAVFIDGANIYATAKMLRFDIDYLRLRKFFGDALVRAYYYTAVKPRTMGEDPLRPLLDWLQYNGYKLVSKETKSFVDAEGRPKIKGNMDMEIAVDMMEVMPYVTDVWLFSGDGDFRYLVEAVQRRGIRVTVCSSIKTVDRTGQAMSVCGDELRRTADTFVDLADLQAQLEKTEDGGMKSKYG